MGSSTWMPMPAAASAARGEISDGKSLVGIFWASSALAPGESARP